MKLKFDGSITINPGGQASCGYVIYDRVGNLIDQGSKIIGRGEGMTINIAEYEGLLMGLRATMNLMHLMHDEEHLYIQGDSQLIINQVSRIWKTKKHHLRILRNEVHRLIIQLNNPVTFQWIPRDENFDADAMA